MTTIIKHTKKNLVGQLTIFPFVSVEAIRFLEKQMQNEKLKIKPEERKTMEEFVAIVQKLPKKSFQHRTTFRMTHNDTGGAMGLYRHHLFYSTVGLGRFLLRSKVHNKETESFFQTNVQTKQFVTVAALQALLPKIEIILDKYQSKITLHKNALEKSKAIKKGLESGDIVFEEQNVANSLMRSETYALYVLMGTHEGFLLPNGELGPLKGALTFETLEGAKRRENLYKNSRVVVLETAIQDVAESVSNWQSDKLREAILTTKRERMEKYLQEASKEQLLERLKSVPETKELLDESDKPVKKLKM